MTTELRERRRMRKHGTLVVTVILLTIAMAGVWLIVDAQKYTSGDVPLPPLSTETDDTPRLGDPNWGVAGMRVITPETMEPNHLFIPNVDPRKVVYAPMVEHAYYDGPEGLRIEDSPNVLSLYDDGAGPCDTEGTTLIAGHVAWRKVKGALFPAVSLSPGTVVYITCADGTLTRWSSKKAVPNKKNRLPQDVFEDIGRRRAVIVTCGGELLRNGHYDSNIRIELEPLPNS